MSQYIRSRIQGGLYFFTVVTHNRRPILCDEPIRTALRNSIAEVRQTLPFTVKAWVMLPDHLHCIWQLPENDANFGKRWGMIKSKTTKACVDYHLSFNELSDSKNANFERGIWQRRFFEHTIRDEQDYHNHLNYIHYNPVKHGLVHQVKDWQYSTFHRFVHNGFYEQDWGSHDTIALHNIKGNFGE